LINYVVSTADFDMFQGHIPEFVWSDWESHSQNSLCILWTRRRQLHAKTPPPLTTVWTISFRIRMEAPGPLILVSISFGRWVPAQWWKEHLPTPLRGI